MIDDQESKEQRILRVLRKVLGNIVKDAMPAQGTPHPFQQSTVDSIRDLFGLIAERERELAQLAGLSDSEKPYYTDEPPTSQIVAMPKPTRKPN